MENTEKKQAAFWRKIVKAIRKRERQELARQIWQLRKWLKEPMPEF